MNHLDFCQGSKYLEDRFHKVPINTLVNSGRLKKAEKDIKEQSNGDIRFYRDCPNTISYEPVSKKLKHFSSFEVDLTQRVANYEQSFPNKKKSKIESKQAINTLHWLAPLTGIMQMPLTKIFCKNHAEFLGAIMWWTSTEVFKAKNSKTNPPKRAKTRLDHAPRYFQTENIKSFIQSSSTNRKH